MLIDVDAPYLWITGELVITGYAPDGDSVRFIPSRLSTLRRLQDGDRVEPDPDDGSVQLRLDGIDAPEKDFQGEAQPLALPARDQLVRLAGFTDVTYGPDDTVTGASPARVPAIAVAALVETNGRPVALLLPGEPSPRMDGDTVAVTTDLLARSVNGSLARSGAAYITVYDSTPPAVRTAFADLGRTARDAALGVWAADRSAGFTLTDQASIGPDGALILPKLFRRATAYLAAGSERSFVDWLAAGGSDGEPTEDDRVTVAGQATTLSALLTQAGTTIALTADPLDLVFAE